MTRRTRLILAAPLVLLVALGFGAWRAWRARHDLAARALERGLAPLLASGRIPEGSRARTRTDAARLVAALRSGRLGWSDGPRLRAIDRALQEAARDRVFDDGEWGRALDLLEALLGQAEGRPGEGW